MSYEDYPWYFENNGVLAAWDITKGDGVIVDVVDSCVNFSFPQISGRNEGNYDCQINSENMSEIEKIHGTAMAGLIVASHAKLMRLEYETEYLYIAGTSPHSFIRNSQHHINYNSVRQVIDRFKEDIPLASNGSPVLFDESERPQILLINLSGGQKSDDPFVRSEWNDLISKTCINGDNILFVSSLGNSKINLDEADIVKNGILPASLNPRKCKVKNMDPLIRVGAVAKSNTELYATALNTGSNYGSKYVDILAPGQAIPILSEVEGYARLGGGTSESAAIVTATISLVVKCKPLSSAEEIRKIILSTANNNQNLEYAVDQGRVLNILSAVKKACFMTDDELKTISVESDGSTHNDHITQQISNEAGNKKKVMINKENNSNSSLYRFINFIGICTMTFVFITLFKLGMRCPHPGIVREEY
jgi:subtilisin family serine protease